MSLRLATALFGVGFVLHNADHVRRGFDVVNDGVIIGGTLAAMLTAVLVTLVALRHPVAPAVAAVVGLSIAFGVSAVHLLPAWGEFSDSSPDGDVDALTYIAVLSEIGGAALVALAAVPALKRNDYALMNPGWR